MIYHCLLIDYLVSLKPRAHIHQFDCNLVGEITLRNLNNILIIFIGRRWKIKKL
jgi:hypothetical protein